MHWNVTRVLVTLARGDVCKNIARAETSIASRPKRAPGKCGSSIQLSRSAHYTIVQAQCASGHVPARSDTRPSVQTIRAMKLQRPEARPPRPRRGRVRRSALAALPMASCVALFFTAPLFIVILSAAWLGETVGYRRWTAVVSGFFGVILV